MQDDAITKTGQLREILSAAIISVRDGALDLDRARTMVKLAAQVNESFYSEIKAQQVAIELGGKPSNLGEMTIGTAQAR